MLVDALHRADRILDHLAIADVERARGEARVVAVARGIGIGRPPDLDHLRPDLAPIAIRIDQAAHGVDQARLRRQRLGRIAMGLDDAGVGIGVQ